MASKIVPFSGFLQREKTNSVQAMPDLSFEQLWNLAEDYGDVSMENSFNGNYRARIRMRDTGHYLSIMGEHRDKYQALKRAICECEKMKQTFLS